ncbi:hypothetical protein D3C81_1153920 [compost metagenome]
MVSVLQLQKLVATTIVILQKKSTSLTAGAVHSVKATQFRAAARFHLIQLKAVTEFTQATLTFVRTSLTIQNGNIF